MFTLMARAPILTAGAAMIGAESPQEDALTSCPSRLHAHSSPFAASSAQANPDSYYRQTASGVLSSSVLPRFLSVSIFVTMSVL